MSRLKNVSLAALLTIVSVVGLYGCGGDSPTATPAPTETPVPPTATTAPPTATAEATATTSAAGGSGNVSGLTGPAIDLITKSQDAMKAVKSYHFTLATETGQSQTPTAASSFTAEGDAIPPDKFRMTLDLAQMGKTEMLLIGKTMYLKQQGQQDYISLPSTSAGGQDVSSPEQAVSIAKYAETADIIGDEQIDGAATTHVRFTYDPRKATASDVAATPTTEVEKATGDMWVDKSNNLVRQIKITSQATPGTSATAPAGEQTVVIKFSNFNETISPPIEAPANATPMPGSLGLPVEGLTPTAVP